MYNLGEHFNIDYNEAITNSEIIFTGKKYRITVYTDKLIRLEYNEEGVFEDRPTDFALKRQFKKPDVTIKVDDKFIEITSSYFHLFYEKETPFKGSYFNKRKNLYVKSLINNRIWYYGHPEVRNFKAPGFSFEFDKKKRLIMSKGLYSEDGFVSFDDTKSNIVEITGTLAKREYKGIDTYLFVYGTDFLGCLYDYYTLTGFPALLPRYALGNWWGKNEDYNDISLKKLIDEFNENKIPLSVLLLNENWHIKNDKTKSGFSWNNKEFSNPQGMIEFLHKNGIRLGLNINPLDGIYPTENYYQEIIKYLTPNKNNIIPFSTLDPKFLDVYLKILIHPLDDIGVDFFALDIHDKKHIYDLWYLSHYHILDMKRNYKRRPLVLARNTLRTPHRYPVLYSGKTLVNWNTLKDIMTSNANAANIGISWWAHDIGGYYKGIEDSELYLRFIQLGVFSSIMKFGSEKGKYYKREPWKWNMKTKLIVSDYLELRHKLIPYLYTEAYKYYKFGLPVMQPVFYKYPIMYDDINNRNEYFLGTELFISPIINKKDYIMNRVIHKFFMPDGTWYDFKTGKKFVGNKDYVSFYKDEDYPVFAKKGAIIPLGYNDNLNDTTPPKYMEVHVFPGKSNTYNLYEDDGSSDLYRKDYYLLTQLDYNYLPNNFTFIIRALEGKSGIVPKLRDYKIIFRNTKEAEEVKVYFNKEQVTYTKYSEGTNFIVELKDVSTVGQVTINCKGSNIEIEAERLINEEIEHILMELPIETEMKEKIDAIIFSNLILKKKRIKIKKLRGQGLGNKFIKLLLKLLEFLETAEQDVDLYKNK